MPAATIPVPVALIKSRLVNFITVKIRIGNYGFPENKCERTVDKQVIQAFHATRVTIQLLNSNNYIAEKTADEVIAY
jgi:hypothetical protein